MSQLIIGILAVAILQIARILYRSIIRPRYILWSQGVPRVKRGSNIVLGNLSDLINREPGVAPTEWCAEYGPTFSFAHFMQTAAVISFDKVAISYILSESNIFHKPRDVQTLLTQTLGNGVATAEGSTHARQRRIMNPSFGPVQIKAMYPIFLEKAKKLQNILSQLLPDGPSQIDMYNYCSRAALDGIGAAGFGHEVNALEGNDADDLANAFETMLRNLKDMSILQFIAAQIPSLHFLVSRSERTITTQRAMATMRSIGTQLVEEKKAAVHNNSIGKDLLSLLVKANVSEELKPSSRLSDEEVLAQITTFLLAGNDTTASALAWALYSLSKNPSAQLSLRTELTQAAFNTPSFDQLNGLEYLDAIVRETLRLHAPASAVSREAIKDTVIPLGEGFVDRSGDKQNHLRVAQGTIIFIPILSMNRSTATWGDDALEFHPERWLPAERAKLPEGAMEIPSVHFPNFLAGSHACIGFRFTLIEMKVILFHLIKTFEFTLVKGLDDIQAQVALATQPVLRSHPKDGAQLPLRVSFVHP